MDIIRPATPLLWTQDGDHGHGCTTRNAAHVKTTTADDAAYIVHACNAYPELVAALRALIAASRKYPSVPMLQGDEVIEGERMDEARALLAKLGEG